MTIPSLAEAVWDTDIILALNSLDRQALAASNFHSETVDFVEAGFSPYTPNARITRSELDRWVADLTKFTAQERSAHAQGQTRRVSPSN